MKLFKTVIPLCLLSDIKCQADVGLPLPFTEKVSILRDRIIELGDAVLFSQKYDENTAISPMSIAGALFMLAAATDGEARAEVGQLLAFSADDPEPYLSYTYLTDFLLDQHEKSYLLNIANGIFYQEGFTPANGYGEQLKTLTRMSDEETESPDIQPTNFAGDATDVINEWVNEKTKGKIPELFVDPIHPNTVAMILSSLYFKGSWQVPFDIVRYKGAYCWNSNNGCDENIEFMSVDNQFNIFWGQDYVVVDVPMTLGSEEESEDKYGKREPYHNRIMTFQMWMPNRVLANEIDHKNFQEKIRNEGPDIRSRMQNRRINLVMPTLSIEFNSDLKEQFMKFGLSKVFDYGYHFTPLFGEENNVEAAVSEIRHAVKLDIDKNGVEGAATTAIGMMFRSMPPDVVADKPFYFTIASQCRGSEYDYNYEVNEADCPYDRTPIFVGKVVDPSVREK
jgi:serpin B